MIFKPEVLRDKVDKIEQISRLSTQEVLAMFLVTGTVALETAQEAYPPLEYQDMWGGVIGSFGIMNQTIRYLRPEIIGLINRSVRKEPPQDPQG